MILPTID